MARARRTGRILDESDVLRNHGGKRFHVGAQTKQVHGDDGASASAEPAGDILRIDVVSTAVNVGEHRRRPAVEHDVRSRHPGKGGYDDLIAWSDAECGENEVQSRGAAC